MQKDPRKAGTEKKLANDRHTIIKDKPAKRGRLRNTLGAAERRPIRCTKFLIWCQSSSLTTNETGYTRLMMNEVSNEPEKKENARQETKFEGRLMTQSQ